MRDHPADAALRAAVVANPDDDTPRVVFADWLEESARGVTCPCGGRYAGQTLHGRPMVCQGCDNTGTAPDGREARSEFVRVQCELARLDAGRAALLDDETDWSRCETESGLAASWCPNCGDCCCRDPEDSMSDDDCPLHAPGSNHCRLDYLARTADALRGRERALWDTAAHWWPFAAPFAGNQYTIRADVFDRGGGQMALVRRGFVERVRCPWEAWVAAADKLVWQPELTDECPTCASRDERRNEQMRRYGGFLCTTCGTHHPPGRVPRPCPESAEPVAEVTLTTLPWSDRVAGDGSGQRYRLSGRAAVHQPSSVEGLEDIVRALLRAEWPSVKAWHLPRVGGGARLFADGREVTGVTAMAVNPMTSFIPVPDELLADAAVPGPMFGPPVPLLRDDAR